MLKPYAQYIEDAIKLNPVFIVGSGLSAGAGISTMGQLATYLIQNVRTEEFSDQERHEWEQIKAKLITEKKGLEEALQDSGEAISKSLLREIIQQTWSCISSDEQKLLLDISNNLDPTGFVRYFKKFKNSNTEIIHIITTNYDHLIEWSASSCGWRVWDGFDEGTIGSPLPLTELNRRMKTISFVGRKPVTLTHHHLRIYKPHGSLSWFRLPDGQLRKVQGVGNYLIPMLGKVHIVPTIVTPGIGKYLETHQEPYNMVLSEMKHVLDNSKALIFLGFGFNDLHIQGSFDSILRNDSIPKIILAMELSANAKKLIENQQLRNFVAVQKDTLGHGSEIISDKIKSFKTTQPEHWTFKMLLNQAWGVDNFESLKSV
ncbi:hypothetical protein POTG_02228 [Paenibacillus sp. oral taxon 786 str. D14]|uniref:SIR2 family protein n=1 Tax=Paenibacillus sp. oral taxon 786 TaxID=652715 RepID=UPI0001AFD9D5|nr:SIR2 family protein [Paenibacillus sp. oral taxon 786]EES73128.1 hypothetical protein POTG_02228 [Paenibacillus sp. oral taxon 786 str. D14]